MFLFPLKKQNIFHFRKIDDLAAQLEFERLKREKCESELDECRIEVVRLVTALRTYEEQVLHSQVKVFFHFSFELFRIFI